MTDFLKLETCGHCPVRTVCVSAQNVPDFTEKVFKPAILKATTPELIALGSIYVEKGLQCVKLYHLTGTELYSRMVDEFTFYTALVSEELLKRSTEGDKEASSLYTEQGILEFHTANLEILQEYGGPDLPLTEPPSKNHPNLN